MAEKEIKKSPPSVTELEEKIADLVAENKQLKEKNQKWVNTEKDWIRRDFLVKKGIEEKLERFYEFKKKQKQRRKSKQQMKQHEQQQKADDLS